MSSDPFAAGASGGMSPFGGAGSGNNSKQAAGGQIQLTDSQGIIKSKEPQKDAFGDLDLFK